MHTAISLVNYDSQVEPAINYAFGNTFVCSGMFQITFSFSFSFSFFQTEKQKNKKDFETAKKVTFHPKIKTRSVTNEGDLFDPSGTLTGGSKPTITSILIKFQKLNELREQINVQKNKLNQIKLRLKDLEVSKNEFEEFSRRLELKKHEVSLLSDRLSHTPFHQVSL